MLSAKKIMWLAAASLLAVSAANAQPAVSPAPGTTSLLQPGETGGGTAWDGWGLWGVNLNTLDPSTAPGDDFFRYVNGRWLDGFEIPADQATYGTFMMLRDHAEQDVHAILEDLAQASRRTPLEQQVGDIYASWMDEAGVEARGLEPVQPFLAQIAAVETHEDLSEIWSNIHMPRPVGVFPFPDPADPMRYTVGVFQAGIGLPDRDYYLLDDERFVQVREAYRDYLVTMMRGVGGGDEVARADRVFALETALAELHWSTTESRDIQRIYNPMTLDELQAYAPQLDWSVIMRELGVDGVESYLVAQNTAIQATAELVEATPIEVWRDYMSVHFISGNADSLPALYADAQFDLFSRQLRGLEEPPERWRSGVRIINTGVGEAVGQVYLDRHFSPENQTSMEMIMGYVREGLRQRLVANPWMDDHTRVGALEKLDSFEPRIAAPDEWTDYSNLAIDADDLFGNRLRIAEHGWNEAVRRLGAPVDRAQWPYPPQTVNASYNPFLNQLTFPAGILQPPFFNGAADPAVNFGGIGATIGHEIGHGFDDQGSQFDAQGRLRNWWSDEARAAFQERTAVLVEQYNAFEPLEGMHINGQLTLGENIGDLGGLELAYAAWRLYADEHYPDGAPVIDGFTGDQRFFLAYAQVWRGLRREDSLRQQLLTDPHSPYDARVNAVLRNMDSWYEAFHIQEGDALYLPPEERVTIW